MLLSSLILLIACGDDGSKTSDPADTADTSGSVDTADTADTGATIDTSTEDSGDTGDTSDTDDSDEPLPECDLLTPYRGCTAIGASTDVRGYFITTWDAEGRTLSEDVYTDATYTTLSRRTVYAYTEGQLTSVEYRGSSDELLYTATYSYDSAGNLVEITMDNEARTTTRYRYDGEGRMVGWDRMSSGRGSGCSRSWTTTATGADYEETCSDGGSYTGTVDTRMLETLRVGQQSGVEFERIERVFRRDCQPVSENRTTATPGGDRFRQHTYDASGRLVQEAVDYPEEGVLQNMTLTYTCPG